MTKTDNISSGKVTNKRGRRWRSDELTGKQKAERVALAMLGETKKAKLSRVLKKLEPDGTAHASLRKAYNRWKIQILKDWGEQAYNYQPTLEDQRQPLGPKPPGMVWADGCWQEMQSYHDALNAELCIRLSRRAKKPPEK